MNIFISYRVQDSDWVSMSLYEQLKKQFPNDQVFKDINKIKAGEDFTKAIDSNLRSCDVLLVVIAESWLTCRDENNNQRLFLPNDYVCMEIATVLQQGKKVIPVLIKNTQMPAEESLPDSIKQLCKMQAFRLSTNNFEMDVFNLANAINESVGRRNQYAEFVKDVATGKVKQEDLVKPETNTAYALVCVCVGALILFLNSESTAIVLICVAMIACGVYAYFISRKVKPYWLNKDFANAKKSARTTRLLSIIAPVSGIILIIVVLLLQGLSFLSNGGMNDINDMMKKIEQTQSQAKPQQQPDPSQDENKTQAVTENNAPPQIDENAPGKNSATVRVYTLNSNADVYANPEEDAPPFLTLTEGSHVEVTKADLLFSKIRTTLQDGTVVEGWVLSAALE